MRPFSATGRSQSTSQGANRFRDSRQRATQPSYDFLSGGDAQRPASRQSAMTASIAAASRESSKENMAPPDAEEYESQRKVIEELKAKIGTLEYSLATAEQEKEMALAKLQAEMGNEKRATGDLREKLDAAELEKKRAAERHQTVLDELTTLRESRNNDGAELEKMTRESLEEARVLKEQLEELSLVRDEEKRHAERAAMDMKMQVDTARRSLDDLRRESEMRECLLRDAETLVSERDAQIGSLEAENLRLKAQSTDPSTLDQIRSDLSEQVSHIRKLEAANSDQLSELRTLRQVAKTAQIVEEEKRTLRRRVDGMDRIQTELAEAQIQIQRLEDEKLAWTAYLQEQGAGEFGTPEDVARALAAERFKVAEHVEELGRIKAEMAGVETKLQALDTEKAELRKQLEDAKNLAATSSADKSRLRLERQRALAVKEVDYLRAQVKMYDTEEGQILPGQFDSARARRIENLEDLVDKYKSEVETLRSDLAAVEPSPASEPSVGSKRARADDEDDASQLPRKYRIVQDQVSSLKAKLANSESELAIKKEELATLREHAKTRVLSLRSNPSTDHFADKLSRLRALEKENADLLTSMSLSADSLVPASTLEAARREVEAARAETASAEKSKRRLKEVWGAKSGEFKEAIHSTLGWTVTFMPNGKMRVESVFMPSKTDEHENSIIFDGERGTMKVGGGPRSKFAERIAEQIGFWVREKGSIPGFLAALTLEFYEESQRSTVVM